MALPLESVPNFSEGREQTTIDALAAALGERVELLDVHADVDHNRSVFTLVGEETDLVDALVAGDRLCPGPDRPAPSRGSASA